VCKNIPDIPRHKGEAMQLFRSYMEVGSPLVLLLLVCMPHRVIWSTEEAALTAAPLVPLRGLYTASAALLGVRLLGRSRAQASCVAGVCQDYNTATFPHKKYYDVEKYEMEEYKRKQVNEEASCRDQLVPNPLMTDNGCRGHCGGCRDHL
jgi:hypothetical protein